MKSAAYLAEHLQQVPVLVIPCIEGRYENAPPLWQAIAWGSILPATWSFMLAARARGVGNSMDDIAPGPRTRRCRGARDPVMSR